MKALPAERSVRWTAQTQQKAISYHCLRIAREFGVKGISRAMLVKFHQTRRVAVAKRNLAQQAEAVQEIVMAGSDAETVEEAVVAILINRAMEVVNMPKITPSFYREVVGLVVRLREQKISMERLKLERARFELDVADLVMKHLDKLKASGALQIEDRSEAAKKIEKSCSANTRSSNSMLLLWHLCKRVKMEWIFKLVKYEQRLKFASHHMTHALALAALLFAWPLYAGDELPEVIGYGEDFERIGRIADDWFLVTSRAAREYDLKNVIHKLEKERDAALAELQAKRRALLEQEEKTNDIRRGEFEKSEEFEKRLAELRARRASAQADDLRKIDQAMEETRVAFESKKREIEKGTIASMADRDKAVKKIEEFKKKPRLFIVPATMDRYDADLEQVTGFSPAFRLLSSDRRYSFNGRIGSLPLDVERAKRVRAASNGEGLWLVVSATSDVPDKDSENYKQDKSTQEIAAEKRERSNKAIKEGAKDALINAVSIALGGGAQNKGIVGHYDEATKEVDSTKDASRTVIRFNWRSVGSVQKIVVYDFTANKHETLWER